MRIRTLQSKVWAKIKIVWKFIYLFLVFTQLHWSTKTSQTPTTLANTAYSEGCVPKPQLTENSELENISSEILCACIETFIADVLR